MTTTAAPRRTRGTGKATARSGKGVFPPPTEWSEQLAVDNKALAMACANKFARTHDIPVKDLEGVAWMGLLKACRLYEPDKINPKTGTPYALSTIAVPFIRGAMKHHIRDTTYSVKFPNRWRELGPKVRRLDQEGRSRDDIAEQMTADGIDITPSEVAEIIRCMRPAGLLTDHHDSTFLHDSADEEQDETGWQYFDHCLELAQHACAGLSMADSEMISEWVAADARRALYPGGPLQQFNAHLRIQLRSRAGHLLR